LETDLDIALDGYASYWTITQNSLALLAAQSRGRSLLTRRDVSDGFRGIDAAMRR
jgi:hypothetical protein